MRRIVLAALLHAVVAPAVNGLRAQLPSDVLADVPRNALIRVADDSGPRVYGRRLPSSRDSLILTAPAPRHRYSFALADIDTVWVQKGTAWKQVGAAGGLTLGLLSVAVVSGLSETSCSRRKCTTLPFIYGGSIGFGIGGALGTLVPRWRRIYPPSTR